MSIEHQYVDRHGQSEVGFAFSYLLGFDLLPRLKAISRQKLYQMGGAHGDNYENLKLVLARPIRWAVAGWLSALNNPQRIFTWMVMAILHPQTFFGGIVDGGEQAKRSDYITFLKRPILPELVMQLRGQWAFAHLPEYKWTDYSAILSEPGALTAALNWYRALDVSEMLASLNNLP